MQEHFPCSADASDFLFVSLSNKPNIERAKIWLTEIDDDGIFVMLNRKRVRALIDYLIVIETEIKLRALTKVVTGGR